MRNDLSPPPGATGLEGLAGLADLRSGDMKLPSFTAGELPPAHAPPSPPPSPAPSPAMAARPSTFPADGAGDDVATTAIPSPPAPRPHPLLFWGDMYIDASPPPEVFERELSCECDSKREFEFEFEYEVEREGESSLAAGFMGEVVGVDKVELSIVVDIAGYSSPLCCRRTT